MSGLKSINKHLAKLKNVTEEAGYYLDFEESIESLGGPVESLRKKLVQIRKDFQNGVQSKKATVARAALHDVLVCLAKEQPLNETVDGVLICPITDERIDSPVTLSNGYTYEEQAIGELAANEKYFPRKIGDAEIEIDEQDVLEAQSESKLFGFLKGGYLGALSGVGILIGLTVLKTYAGINLATFILPTLLTIGLSATVAGIVAALTVFIVPILVCFVIGGIAGYAHYKSHHPSQLAPVVEAAPAPAPAANDKPSSSTALAFDGMDAKPAPIPALTQRQVIVNDQPEDDAPEKEPSVTVESDAEEEFDIDPSMRPV